MTFQCSAAELLRSLRSGHVLQFCFFFLISVFCYFGLALPPTMVYDRTSLKEINSKETTEISHPFKDSVF